MSSCPATQLPDTPAAASSGESLWQRLDKTDLARTLFVAFTAVLVAAGLTGPWDAVPLFAVVGLAVGNWPILVESFEDIKSRRMSMELSMLIAVIAAAAIGEWTTALVVTAFVLAAEILEDLSLDRGRDALTDLMAFLPRQVQLRTPDGLRQVPLEEVAPQQIVVVSPGGRVPVDGVVTSGISELDESRITGESAPVAAAPGSEVYAGSVNQLGALEIRATKVGTESSYGQIIAAVRAAQESQAPVQRLADRLAAYLVYFALAAAGVTFLVTRDLTATISVIIVAGACGIAAGTPLAVLGAIGRAARTGAFIKDGAHLEALSEIDTVVFDKTGTLTTGTPQVVEVLPAPGFTRTSLLTTAAAAEFYSEHPLGRAIVRAAASLPDAAPLTPGSDMQYTAGQGITARVGEHTVQVGNSAALGGVVLPEGADTSTDGTTRVHVAVDGAYAGAIALRDTVRDSAAGAVRALHDAGLRTVMLTGDHSQVARAIAAEVGITEVHAELLPADKLTVLEDLKAQGLRLAMVGDGVNDAPALAHAAVGIAMGSGTEIARQSADVVLISSDLGDLAATVAVAKRARRIVMFNFVGTLAVDVVGMALAAFGLLGPVLAALIHVGSESAFILNSARLVPGRRAGAGE